MYTVLQRWYEHIGPSRIEEHWRRDVTLCEDHPQVRTQYVPAILALLNNTILALMDLLGVCNVPKQMRRSDAHPGGALRLLLGSL